MVAMELLLGPQPLVRPVFTQHGTENMDIEECADGRERAASVDSSEGAEYERKDYVEIKYARALDASKSPASGDESRLASGNYRAELKRPDLKGSFRCSICAKVFCHSSSLSRHRMQAHFKSYKCTLCRKDITSNETLRAHMYKQHQISRMFMCRCCNWAFPDKTSLHMHIQAREEGKSITVPVIGKGLAPDGVDSQYPNLHPINNNTLPQMQNPGVLTPTPGLPFFSAPPPPLTSSTEDMSRLRDRLVLNSLMTQPGFGLAAAWLNNLPKPIPTTKPLVDLMKKDTREEDECEVNVENDSAQADDDKLNISSSESDEGKSLVIKRTESPCENGSSTSSDSLSPAHTSSAHSPVNLFKKGDTPSAFHHLNVDSRFAISPSHVSPSETHSSASPNGCYDCAVYKTKLTMADNKCRYLESRGNTLQTEAVRAQAQISSAEAALRALEAETRALREQTEMLHRRLLDCQEQAVRFMQCDRASNPQAVALFMNHLIQSTIIR
nr:Zinc finger domain containing protein [Haemonchus contortus]